MTRSLKAFLGTSALVAMAGMASADQVFTDDVIIDGSLCVGVDCVNGESFGFDTIRLKENNLRIRAFDTSSSGSFPTVDWQITFNDSVNGGDGFDDLKGGIGDDALDGGKDDDSLDGGDGNDLLQGGFGDDVMTGGAGADVFHIIPGNGADTITDFTAGEDLIDLSAQLLISMMERNGQAELAGTVCRRFQANLFFVGLFGFWFHS